MFLWRCLAMLATFAAANIQHDTLTPSTNLHTLDKRGPYMRLPHFDLLCQNRNRKYFDYDDTKNIICNSASTFTVYCSARDPRSRSIPEGSFACSQTEFCATVTKDTFHYVDPHEMGDHPTQVMCVKHMYTERKQLAPGDTQWSSLSRQAPNGTKDFVGVVQVSGNPGGDFSLGWMWGWTSETPSALSMRMYTGAEATQGSIHFYLSSMEEMKPTDRPYFSAMATWNGTRNTFVRVTASFGFIL